MTEPVDAFKTVGVRQVLPDPSVLQAIGLNHSLETAVADLVDNSIDAEAQRVLIRFVLRDGLIRSLIVVDNGNGMNSSSVDIAMQLGGQPERSADALGHFGIGLKAASFSQADCLTVLSRSAGGQGVGRQITRGREDGFAVATLETAQVEQFLDLGWTDFRTPKGTVLVWDRLRNFPHNAKTTKSFIEKSIERLMHHLGLVFHRLIERRLFRLEIDVFDEDFGEAGFPFEVEPIDPFAYRNSGDSEYPKLLTAAVDSQTVPIICHVWPGRSNSPLFKLAGRSVEATQGFYLYRNDRLLSAGGWSGVASPSKKRRLARVSIDIEEFEHLFQMSSEKSGVRFAADLARAITSAEAHDGVTFQQYLSSCEAAFQESNRRTAKRPQMLPPGQGLAPKTRRAVAREVPILEGEEPLRIRWRQLGGSDFVDVDRENRTLWINVDYRKAVLQGTHGGVNDAPLLKALLYLLYEDIFRGAAFGAKDKDNVNMWREILNAAAQEERAGYVD